MIRTSRVYSQVCGADYTVFMEVLNSGNVNPPAFSVIVLALGPLHLPKNFNVRIIISAKSHRTFVVSTTP